MKEPLNDEIYWQIVEKMRVRISDRIAGEVVVIFDAFERDEEGMPIDNLDEIAYRGVMRLVYDIHDYYNGPILVNPTWMEIAIHANEIMIATGDRHHVFLDGIYEVRIEQTTPRDVSIDTSS